MFFLLVVGRYYLHAANRVDLEAWLDAFRNTTIAGLRQM
jgi:hypothetical protein